MPVQREERSALPRLLAVMQKNPKALEALERLKIGRSASEKQADEWGSLFGGLSDAFSGLGSTDSDEDLKAIFDEIGELARARASPSLSTRARASLRFQLARARIALATRC